MPFPRLIVVALTALSCAAVAGAVEVQFWSHATAEDHADALRDGTVVTSYGAVQLTRKLTPLAEAIDGASLVYDVAEAADGTVYAATGPTGVLLRVKGEQTDRYELADAENLLCLLPEPDGSLLVGTGGADGRIVRVRFEGDAARVETLFKADGVRYVWKLARHADGTLYAATGRRRRRALLPRRRRHRQVPVHRRRREQPRIPGPDRRRRPVRRHRRQRFGLENRP